MECLGGLLVASGPIYILLMYLSAWSILSVAPFVECREVSLLSTIFGYPK
jgi:hypothetical protein